MKKFEFKLQALLKIKEIEEKKKLAELAVVVNRYQKNVDEINKFDVESNFLLQQESSRLKSEKTLDFQYMRGLSRYLDILRNRRNNAQKNLNEMATELSNKQKEVAGYRVRRRAIEILKEKQLDEHSQRINRETISQLDEFNSRKRVV
jgi:flagellar export protein FliJ